MDRFSRDSANLGRAHDVAILMLPGVVPLDLAIPLQAFGPWPPYMTEMLGGASSPYRVRIVGEPGAPFGGWFTTVDPEPLERMATADTVVVPGLLEPSLPVDDRVLEAIRNAHAAGARIVSICTGAFILAQAGILDGRKATTHWRWAGDMRARHPAVEVADRRLYVDEGGIITSAGVLAGVDVCIHIIDTDLGRHVANTLARFLVSPPHREGGQAQYTSEPMARHADLALVTEWISEHLCEPLSVGRIAAAAHMSVRTMSRRFRAAFGTSVMDWVVRQRVSRSRELLESTDLPIADVAYSCGFGSVESFRARFAEFTMTSPSRYRAAFGGAPASL